jgi:hypothetical protein
MSERAKVFNSYLPNADPSACEGTYLTYLTYLESAQQPVFQMLQSAHLYQFWSL